MSDPPTNIHLLPLECQGSMYAAQRLWISRRSQLEGAAWIEFEVSVQDSKNKKDEGDCNAKLAMSCWVGREGEVAEG